MSDLSRLLDRWFEQQQAGTVMIVNTGGRVTCILRSGVVTVGRVGEGPDTETAIRNALSRPPHTVPNRPAREIVTRPITDYQTRDDLLPGM